MFGKKHIILKHVHHISVVKHIKHAIIFNNDLSNAYLRGLNEASCPIQITALLLLCFTQYALSCSKYSTSTVQPLMKAGC